MKGLPYRCVLEDPEMFHERPVQWFESSQGAAELSAKEVLNKKSSKAGVVKIYKSEEKLIKTVTQKP